jgi:hypothetical protein
VAAVQTFVGLELKLRPRRVRLETGQVHRPAAVADRQQERVPPWGLGECSRHGAPSFRMSNRDPPVTCGQSG